MNKSFFICRMGHYGDSTDVAAYNMCELYDVVLPQRSPSSNVSEERLLISYGKYTGMRYALYERF